MAGWASLPSLEGNEEIEQFIFNHCAILTESTTALQWPLSTISQHEMRRLGLSTSSVVTDLRWIPVAAGQDDLRRDQSRAEDLRDCTFDGGATISYDNDAEILDLLARHAIRKGPSSAVNYKRGIFFTARRPRRIRPTNPREDLLRGLREKPWPATFGQTLDWLRPNGLSPKSYPLSAPLPIVEGTDKLSFSLFTRQRNIILLNSTDFASILLSLRRWECSLLRGCVKYLQPKFHTCLDPILDHFNRFIFVDKPIRVQQNILSRIWHPSSPLHQPLHHLPLIVNPGKIIQHVRR